MYTALTLDKNSREKLIQQFISYIPKDYEIIAHHMTINMGKISNGPLAEKDLGKEVELQVVSIAWDDKVIAVGVDTVVPSKNSRKHITLAVNRNAGGKPFFSNKLKDWEPLPDGFALTLTGIITEEK